jgi:hypothetical protein
MALDYPAPTSIHSFFFAAYYSRLGINGGHPTAYRQAINQPIKSIYQITNKDFLGLVL